jgi:hypothetical protein
VVIRKAGFRVAEAKDERAAMDHIDAVVEAMRGFIN